MVAKLKICAKREYETSVLLTKIKNQWLWQIENAAIEGKQTLSLHDFYFARQAIQQSYSGSAGLLKSTLSLMLPCPNWGNPAVSLLPGFKFEAVSSGGNSTSEFR